MNGSDSQTSKSPLWDWPSWMKGSVPNPLDVFATPQNLVQPILPGVGVRRRSQRHGAKLKRS